MSVRCWLEACSSELSSLLLCMYVFFARLSAWPTTTHTHHHHAAPVNKKSVRLLGGGGLGGSKECVTKWGLRGGCGDYD